MKVIKHNLGDIDHAVILPLADLHLGDPHSDFAKIQEWLAYIRDNDDVYCILNGDLMDTAIATSIGDTYGAALQPMEQLRQCVTLFEPIKNKVLAVLPGNHESRIYKNVGLDLTETMCAQLGILERYSPATALLFVRLGADTGVGRRHRPVLYTIYCVHGSGGGRKEGGKLQRLVDLSAICDADIYVHSHTHLPAIAKTGYFRVSSSTSTVQRVDKLFINTSSAIEYGGYGEVQSFKPSSTDTPLIRLDGTKKRATAAL